MGKRSFPRNDFYVARQRPDRCQRSQQHHTAQIFLPFSQPLRQRTEAMISRVKSLMCDAVAVCGLTLLVLVWGCGGGGTSTPAVPLTLKSIAVTGASSVNVGATDPFTATGTFSDGTTRNLTASVTWSSSTPANATISATGLATGVHSSTTMIAAKDNATGITSPAVTLTVVAVLSSIAITPIPPFTTPPARPQHFAPPPPFNTA